MTSGSVWALAPARDASVALAPISTVAAARNTVSRNMVASKPTAWWPIAALLASVPVNCFVASKLGAMFANVESDQAIGADRIPIPEVRDSLRTGEITGNFLNFDYLCHRSCQITQHLQLLCP